MYPNLLGQKAGSPPHLRGKPRDMNLALYAYKDHPRTCGENLIDGQIQKYGEGSPPHLRGKRSHLQENGPLKRITPAPAGKTSKIPNC